MVLLCHTLGLSPYALTPISGITHPFLECVDKSIWKIFNFISIFLVNLWRPINNFIIKKITCFPKNTKWSPRNLADYRFEIDKIRNFNVIFRNLLEMPWITTWWSLYKYSNDGLTHYTVSLTLSFTQYIVMPLFRGW